MVITRIPLLLLALALAPACHFAPRVAVETPFGLARAETPTEARALAVLLEEMGSQVREILPDTRDRPTEVWLDDFSRYGALKDRPGVVGLTALGNGHIRIRSDRLGRDADFVLGHELVHALLGESWEPLPAVLKEGLCDTIAARLAPRAAERVTAIRLFNAGAGQAGMTLELSLFDPVRRIRLTESIPVSERPRPSLAEALSHAGPGMHLDDQLVDHDTLYGYGFIVVQRIVERQGLEGLRRLCLRASEAGHETVPTAWILAAADLSEGQDAWVAAVLDRTGPLELEFQAEYLSAQLAAYLAGTFRYRYPSLTAVGFLDSTVPTVGWVGGRTRVALSTVSSVVADLEASWDGAGPRALAVGEGWWFHDRTGVHLTTLLAPREGEPHVTLSRLLLEEELADPAADLPDVDQAEVEALVHLGLDAEGGFLRTALPRGFAHFRLEMDGYVVADLERGLNAELGEDELGWVTITSRLPGDLALEGMVLYPPAANLLLTQRAPGREVVREQHFPLLVPRR